jgi:hypothetical protein
VQLHSAGRARKGLELKLKYNSIQEEENININQTSQNYPEML